MHFYVFPHIFVLPAMPQKETYSPWQSWSPATPNYLHLPIRDYSPVPEIAPENPMPPEFNLKEPISGWCSWYRFGRSINEARLLKQAERIKKSELDLKYFLIDDGWCRWGDWLAPEKHKFPDLASLTGKLINLGYKPGLWIAPFLADPDSSLVRKHPDWLVADETGKPVNGLKVFPFDNRLPWRKYILDFSLPEVKEYILKSLDHLVEGLGASLVKLDFLYAPYFKPGLISDEVPNRHLLDIFSHLKHKYPDVYTIACGCPYKPARFMVDAIRISKDISWPDLNFVPFLNHLVRGHRFRLLRENIKALADQNKFFHLDPDVHLRGLPLAFYRATFAGTFFTGD